MLDNEVLYNNIKKLCEINNMKITNLEKELNFGGGIISRWGKNADPSLGKVIEIADYFDVSLDELIGKKYEDNDEFIDSLINITKNKKIKWSDSYNSVDNKFRPVSRQLVNIVSNNDDPNIVADGYYAKTDKGYVSIYATYQYKKITNPENIELYIQPSESKDYFRQDYESNILFPLWKCILFSLEDNDKPNEILIEEFKKNIIGLRDEKAGE